ncbi:GLPGLI family protein [Chryseobacterium sp. CBTAP 102]|uniref:GLPGLI family protein n=1 Tax=Chryseobacterium sp. CBTAP 102 TaxID=2135644 RepID=UPI000D764068|nr:GLPGLI family protein [Chryseobacterium sp. CBTAP 102]PXW17962.1 GLPGLI family protein [Chryseobacterium sp. CBTAP 102]
MKKILLLSSILISGFYFAQQVHVKYLRVLSSFTTTHEDLYIKNNQVLSIQDSIIINNKLTDSWTLGVNLDNGKKPAKQYFVSDLDKNNEAERNFFFTSNVDSREFFIYDKVPQPKWNIEEKETKTIAGYKCQKATTMFRGSKVTAYFTKDLPYSTGPFKFYGLPGLILDIRVDNKDYDIWKAESVDVNDKSAIAFKPQFLKKEKISLKDYVAAKEAHMNKIFAKLTDALPKNYNARVTTNQRFSVEQKYEWEDKPSE